MIQFNRKDLFLLDNTILFSKSKDKFKGENR